MSSLLSFVYDTKRVPSGSDTVHSPPTGLKFLIQEFRRACEDDYLVRTGTGSSSGSSWGPFDNYQGSSEEENTSDEDEENVEENIETGNDSALWPADQFSDRYYVNDEEDPYSCYFYKPDWEANVYNNSKDRSLDSFHVIQLYQPPAALEGATILRPHPENVRRSNEHLFQRIGHRRNDGALRVNFKSVQHIQQSLARHEFVSIEVVRVADRDLPGGEFDRDRLWVLKRSYLEGSMEREIKAYLRISQCRYHANFNVGFDYLMDGTCMVEQAAWSIIMACVPPLSTICMFS